MKTLHLLRHAKSSNDDPGLPDRERPLAARGERDAAAMGRRWSRRLGKLDLIVASPALRALSTARIVAEGLGDKGAEIVVDERLYAAATETLLAVVEALDDKLECVMLVGHNPEFTALAHRFDAGIAELRTCALASFEFGSDTWSGIVRIQPARTALDLPKS
ncbi:MAG: histidine phosphatase family protein [Burkholderiaceae bacterium]|nr:histidine phosphatase family protein [Roseateles sp.]MBV8470491.1 histidine phosphatase family protein [Burkholderiaceae bacterium]